MENFKNLEIVGIVVSSILVIIFAILGIYIKGGWKASAWTAAIFSLIGAFSFGIAYYRALRNK